MAEHLERELKLSAPAGFHLPDLGGTELPGRSFVSTYHDTQDLRLARHGITFRHRLENGAGLWQLKLPRGEARLELEEAGPPARPPEQLLGLLVAFLRDAELVRVARLGTRRKSVQADGAEIVDDSVSVLDGQRVTSRFREIEVELLEGDERSLRRLEAALREAGAEPGRFEPKLFRVLELAYPLASALPAGSTPREVLGSALDRERARLLAHDPGTRLGSDAEELHQMRVATRRGRAFLRTVRPLLEAEWAESLRAELRWLGSELGRARDLDVLSGHLRVEVRRLGEAETEAQGLLETLDEERRRAHERAVATLSTERYFALLDRLEEGALRAAAETADGSLAALWWQDVRRASRAFRGLDDGSEDSELHAMRIRVKRARYAAELAAAELGESGARFVAAVKRVQDMLGEHQDAVVAQDRITRWVAEGGSGEVAERLLRRERSRQRGARAKWTKAWARAEQKAKRARP